MAWNKRSFAESADLIRDVVQPNDIGNIPYIGLEHISQGQLSLMGFGYSDEVVSAKFRFRKGDILYGKLRPYFRKVIIAPFDGVCSTDIWVIRAKPGVHQRFLFYWMASTEFVDAATRASEGTKMPRAKWEFVERIEKFLPEEDEQRAIAEVLGALDDKIELNRRMNQTLEALAQTIFKSWFIDFEPVRAKLEGRQPAGMDAEMAALFPDAMDGDVPRGWRKESLDQVAHFLNGLALQKYPPTGDEFLPVIKIAQLRTENTDGADKASVSIPKEYVVENGDMLFSWSGSLDVVIWCGGKGALNQHLFKVTSDKYPKWFYYHWVLHHLPNFQAIAAGKATTMGHIQRHHLSEAKVSVPDTNILREMNQVIAPILEKIILNKLESHTLANLRDSLLPKLLSGEVKVSNLDPQDEL